MHAPPRTHAPAPPPCTCVVPGGELSGAQGVIVGDKAGTAAGHLVGKAAGVRRAGGDGIAKLYVRSGGDTENPAVAGGEGSGNKEGSVPPPAYITIIIIKRRSGINPIPPTVKNRN